MSYSILVLKIIRSEFAGYNYFYVFEKRSNLFQPAFVDNCYSALFHFATLSKHKKVENRCELIRPFW